LTDSSYRYAYLLWIVLATLLFIWTACFHLPTRGGFVGAFVRKWTLRRWSVRLREKTVAIHDGKIVTPTLFQLVSLAVFIAAVFCLCYIGPDLLDGVPCQGDCPAQPNTSSTIVKRQVGSSGWTPSNDTLVRYLLSNVSEHSADTPSQLVAPTAAVQKSLWTSSNRVGLIAFALTPLVTITAIKSWPFAVLATPFVVGVHFDKAAFFHRQVPYVFQIPFLPRLRYYPYSWVGRIIWALSTVHVGLWTRQLFIDRDPFGQAVFYTVWRYYHFCAGAAVSQFSPHQSTR
jgi:hypothetical protein